MIRLVCSHVAGGGTSCGLICILHTYTHYFIRIFNDILLQILMNV